MPLSSIDIYTEKMEESLVKTAKEFANRLNYFTNLSQETYNVKQQAKNIPLEFIRLNIAPEINGISTVRTAFHLLDPKTGGIGDEFYTIDIDVPTVELDKFIITYKIPQVDGGKTRKHRFIDYYLNGFLGTYNAVNFS